MRRYLVLILIYFFDGAIFCQCEQIFKFTFNKCKLAKRLLTLSWISRFHWFYSDSFFSFNFWNRGLSLFYRFWIPLVSVATFLQLLEVRFVKYGYYMMAEIWKMKWFKTMWGALFDSRKPILSLNINLSTRI